MTIHKLPLSVTGFSPKISGFSQIANFMRANVDSPLIFRLHRKYVVEAGRPGGAAGDAKAPGLQIHSPPSNTGIIKPNDLGRAPGVTFVSGDFCHV